MANTRIIGFYSREIQEWPDDLLEAVHDFIQWLFPLPEPSGFNVAAPVLNPESMQEFRKRPELQQNLRVSFLRMMKFYGLEVDLPNKSRSAPNFTAEATVWLSPGNHNHLRITRILRCLSLLGLEAEVKAFFDCLSAIYENEQSRPQPAISAETILYWRRAVGDAGW